MGPYGPCGILIIPSTVWIHSKNNYMILSGALDTDVQKQYKSNTNITKQLRKQQHMQHTKNTTMNKYKQRREPQNNDKTNRT